MSPRYGMERKRKGKEMERKWKGGGARGGGKPLFCPSHFGSGRYFEEEGPSSWRPRRCGGEGVGEVNHRLIAWLQHDEGRLVLFHDHRGYVVKLVNGYEMQYADVHEAVEELVQELRGIEFGEMRGEEDETC